MQTEKNKTKTENKASASNAVRIIPIALVALLLCAGIVLTAGCVNNSDVANDPIAGTKWMSDNQTWQSGEAYDTFLFFNNSSGGHLDITNGNRVMFSQPLNWLSKGNGQYLVTCAPANLSAELIWEGNKLISLYNQTSYHRIP